jgi:hypothetical protein
MTASLRLKNWVGYRAGKDRARSSGEIDVEGRGLTALGPAQREAVRQAQKNAATMQRVLLGAIVRAYPTFRAWHPRPKKVTAASLRELVELWQITAMKEKRDGVAYLVYQFACAWDPSGIRVVTHDDRVVAAGGSEVYEVAEADAGVVAKLPTAAARRKAKVAAKARARRNPRRWPANAEELEVVLPEWAGFVAGAGPKPATGAVAVDYGGDEVSPPKPGAPHDAALRAIAADAPAMQRVILDALASAYPRLRGEGGGAFMPATMTAAALHDAVELVTVHIHPTCKDGVAYVGYQLACAWDPEHAVGVLTHGDRVVEVGSGETAFLSWIARRDAAKKPGRAPSRRSSRRH